MDGAGQLEQRSIALEKGKHRWILTWTRGEEAHLLRALSDLARRRQSGFEWLDAALVSQHIEEELSAELLSVSVVHPLES